MSDPVRAEARPDGIVIWSFPVPDGTVDIEAATKADAISRYGAFLADEELPPPRDPLAAAVEALDPSKATVGDLIAAIKAARR